MARRSVKSPSCATPIANSTLELEELRSQLQASTAQLDNASAADSGTSERQTQLENALIDLKQQLEKSQAQVRQLESSPIPVFDASASEACHREESQRLQARIAELENDLSASAEITRKLDTLQQRLRESEKLEQEMRDSLQRRENEIPQWQERIAASEEIKQRLLALQPVYDHLVAKQSSLIEHQRAYHGELKSFAQFLSASHDGTIVTPTLYRSPGRAGNGDAGSVAAHGGVRRRQRYATMPRQHRSVPAPSTKN